MRTKHSKKWLSAGLIASIALSLMPAVQLQAEPQTDSTVVINEVESSDADGGNDWVEIYNTGSSAVDISGWYILDNDPEGHAADVTPLPEGTVLQPGEVRVLEEKTDFNFGLGKEDEVNLYNEKKELVDSYSWSSHASGTYARVPDGTGDFQDQTPTKGALNSAAQTDPDPVVTDSGIVINEIESNGDATDWVEIYNAGDSAVDISGWYILDNDPVKHAADVKPAAEGTVLQPGAYYVFDGASDFSFGLGAPDSVTVYRKDGTAVASFAWEKHAAGVLARIPNGTGELIDFAVSTKGSCNMAPNPVVINEVQSNDPNHGPDWIELANPTGETLDISGLVIKDDDDAHAYVIPEGTTIAPCGFLVFTDEEFGFGLGKNDMVRLYENGELIASTTWPEHTSPTWGLYPDVNGTEYRSTLEETPGTANVFAGAPKTIAWPGSDAVIVSDLSFLEDSSGLDFYNGQLYAVDNGTGKFWVLDVAEDGTLTFASGFENGKTVNFVSPTAKGPDTEGITVDAAGFVYLASERDNSNKNVNYNVILKADPRVEGDSLTALQQWDLTELLPDVAANMGIEAVEWISNADADGKLYDQNTGAAFDPAEYPNAVSGGIFFVALEDNGHVYAFVLNADSSAVLIADIDSLLGGAMALDYDTYEQVLWAAADDGYGNRAAKISLNGSAEPDIVLVAPPAGLDITRNNEGFAIAEARYTVNSQRPVYRFADGLTSGALTIGWLDCDYVASPDEDSKSEEESSQPESSENNPESSAPASDPEQSGESGASGQEAPAAGTQVLKTGDTADQTFWIALSVAVLCLLIMGCALMLKRKQKDY